MTPTELLESLRTKINSDTCFIIGGGPSLLKYLPDKTVLNGKCIITTNNAYHLFPNALAAHFADKTWWGWNKDKFLKQFNGPITTCQPWKKNDEFRNSRIITFINGDKKGGITTEKNKLNGCNAGHHAINLAVHLGFKKIVLIGFDMNMKDPKTHWHNEHLRPTNKDNWVGTMIPAMKQIVPYQEQLGFKVYNINPDSAIRCFTFAKLEDFL